MKVSRVSGWYYLCGGGITVRTLSLKVPEELDAALDDGARKLRISKSELMRRVLAKSVRRARAGETFGERAGRLIGCLQGPGDLSTNPRYMRGYGE
jgi:hypothetical protein